MSSQKDEIFWVKIILLFKKVGKIGESFFNALLLFVLCDFFFPNDWPVC